MVEACDGCERMFGNETECFTGPCNFANQGPTLLERHGQCNVHRVVATTTFFAGIVRMNGEFWLDKYLSEVYMPLMQLHYEAASFRFNPQNILSHPRRLR